MTRKIESKKLIYFIVSFIAAVCLWLYVTGYVNPEKETTIYNIPVTFTGEEAMFEDHSLVIADDQTATVAIHVGGRWSILSKLSSKNMSAVVDLSTVKSDGEVALWYDLVFPDGIKESDFNFVDRDSAYIHINVVKLEKKSVEVRGVLGEESVVNEGYLAKAFVFEPETVDIMGTKEKLATVSHALVTFNRTNINKSITDEMTYDLISYEGEVIDWEEEDITLLEETVSVTLPVVKTKEIPLVVEVIEGGGATQKNMTRSIEPSTVTISGDAEILDGISQITLGTIDLSEVINTETYEFPIVIPNETENLDGVEKATVTIKLSGLDTKNLDVSQIELKNKTEGLTSESVTTSVTVVVRAPEDEIDYITANNVRLVADLTDYNSIGRYEVPVKVHIDGYEDAGCIGEYKIVVDISEPAPVTASRFTGETGEDDSDKTVNGTDVRYTGGR